MGKGKGPVEYWVAVVKPGRMMFEVGGTDPDTARRALRRAKYKLSVRSKIVARDVAGEA
jgi:large subunit ribosomal protein L16